MERIDVLAVLRRHLALAKEVASDAQVDEAREVLEAVAELIDADREYDRMRLVHAHAQASPHELEGRVKGGYDRERIAADLQKAADRRRAAIARVRCEAIKETP